MSSKKAEERCPNCGYCPHCGQSRPSPFYFTTYQPLWPGQSWTVPYWYNTSGGTAPTLDVGDTVTILGETS